MESKINQPNAINQIMGRSPSWILRWGILVVAFSFLLLSLLAWLIRYPDVVSAKVKLHTAQLPITVQMPQDGRIDSLLTNANSEVSKGQLIAFLQSTAQYEDVLNLEAFLKKKEYSTYEQLGNLQLGAIATTWADFKIHQKELDFLKKNDVSTKKNQYLQQQIQQLEQLNQSLELQKNTFEEALTLTQKAKTRNEQLLKHQSISIQEVEQSSKAFLSAKQALEIHSNSMIANQIQIEQLRANMLDITSTQQQAHADITLKIEKATQNIQSNIQEWKQQHLIYAPIQGTINLLDNWTIGQFLPAQTSLLTIIPKNSANQKVMASAYLQSTRLGKIKEGAIVNIQLDAYPYQEFGVLKGKVQTIPAIAESDYYRVIIDLDSLTTTYNKQIPFRPEMEGTAKIITQKRRLAARFFDKIWSISKNQ